MHSLWRRDGGVVVNDLYDLFVRIALRGCFGNSVNDVNLPVNLVRLLAIVKEGSG